MLSFWRFTHSNIFDITSPENDVLINFLYWGSRPIWGTVFSAKGPYFGERQGGIVGVDGVENALLADLRLGDEADLAAQIPGAGCLMSRSWQQREAPGAGAGCLADLCGA